MRRRDSGHGWRGIPLPTAAAALRTVRVVVQRGPRRLGQTAGQSVLRLQLHIAGRRRLGTLPTGRRIVVGGGRSASVVGRSTAAPWILQAGTWRLPDILLDGVVHRRLELLRAELRHRHVETLVVGRRGGRRSRGRGRGSGTALLRRGLVVGRTLPAVVGTRLLVLVARITGIHDVLELVVVLADGSGGDRSGGWVR